MNNDLIDLAERAIDEWITAHDGEEIDCRALARVAGMQGEVGGLREALEAARGAIASVDEAQLGYVEPQHDDDTGYPIQAELLSMIDAALAASPPVDQGADVSPEWARLAARANKGANP